MGEYRSMEVAKIIQAIAREHHTTPEEVRRSIQSVIDDIYANPNKTKANELLQDAAPRAGDIPTVDEFLPYFCELKNMMMGAVAADSAKPNRAERRRKNGR